MRPDGDGMRNACNSSLADSAGVAPTQAVSSSHAFLGLEAAGTTGARRWLRGRRHAERARQDDGSVALPRGPSRPVPRRLRA